MFPVQRLPRSSWNVVTACKVGSAPLVKALGRPSVSPHGKAGVRSQGKLFPVSTRRFTGFGRGKAPRLRRLPCFRYVGETLGLVGVMLERTGGAGSGSDKIQGARANSATRPAPQIHIHHSPLEIRMKVQREPCFSLPCPKFPCISR